MKYFARCLIVLALAPWSQPGAAPSAPSLRIDPDERLGSVSFAVSCAAAVRAPFNRGVALLHDFWYDEAERQFQRIAARDPACAMAYWGIAMSSYHQIWDRPDADTLAKGWTQMQRASKRPARTARERAYIAAREPLVPAGRCGYQAASRPYSAAMGELYRRYPERHRCGRLLRAVAARGRGAGRHQPGRGAQGAGRAQSAVREVSRSPGGGSLHHPRLRYAVARIRGTRCRAALRRDRRLRRRTRCTCPDIFLRGSACGRTTSATISPRWPRSQVAEKRHESDGMDQFHSDDFLIYAYLQSGQEARAKRIDRGDGRRS